jgi:hypothetical protein
MKKTLLLLSFLLILVFAGKAAEYRIAASPAGALADVIEGTKPLRKEGISLESSANIVELRFKFIRNVDGKRESFRTLKGDTFFFNNEAIWLRRKGNVLAIYHITNKEVHFIGQFEFTFGYTAKKVSPILSNATSATSTYQSDFTKYSSLAPVVVITGNQATLIRFEEPLSFEDSLLRFPEAFGKELSIKQIGMVLKLAYEEAGFEFQELPDSIIVQIEQELNTPNNNRYFNSVLKEVEEMSPSPPLPPIQEDDPITTQPTPSPRRWFKNK